MTKIYPASKENITRAAEIIKSGGLVSFPTETVYGLGANALNAEAAAKIFEAKKRPFFDPLIVHIAESEHAEALAPDAKELAGKIMEHFWPGPLTIVLPRAASVPDIITSGLPTVAVRVPDHPVALELIREAGVPIAAPSANTFGAISPTRAEHVLNDLGQKLDMILDGGPCAVGLESTIIKLEAGKIFLLRPGGTPVEELEKILGRIYIGNEKNITEAPGMLPYHYAPVTPLTIFASVHEVNFDETDAAFLFFRTPPDGLPPAVAKDRVAVLSSTGDMREAAANIFSVLHCLDRSGAKRIYAQAVPAGGLGLAIMDRLKKAAKKTEH